MEKGIVMIYEWNFFSLNVKWCVVVVVVVFFVNCGFVSSMSLDF